MNSLSCFYFDMLASLTVADTSLPVPLCCSHCCDFLLCPHVSHLCLRLSHDTFPQRHHGGSSRRSIEWRNSAEDSTTILMGCVFWFVSWSDRTVKGFVVVVIRPGVEQCSANSWCSYFNQEMRVGCVLNQSQNVQLYLFFFFISLEDFHEMSNKRCSIMCCHLVWNKSKEISSETAGDLPAKCHITQAFQYQVHPSGQISRQGPSANIPTSRYVP